MDERASAGLHRCTAKELLRGFSTRDFSPVEAMWAVLAQQRAADPQVNAFREVAAERALQDAHDSEQRWLRGQPSGLLDGVPISVKDVLPTQGMATLFGSRTIPADHLAHSDSPSVQRARNAGAVVFGKTTTPEFALKVRTDSPLTGVTRNPWRPELSCGGSSGGAAVAVACGMGPLALGTDGGGSIRIPAAWTGIAGFKPSQELVAPDHAQDFARLTCTGPLARTAEDTALLARVLLDAAWGAACAESLRRSPRGIAGLRIALCTDLGLLEVDPEISALVEDAARWFAAQGARVDRLDRVEPLRGLRESRMHAVHWGAAAALLLQQTPPALRVQLDAEVIRLAAWGGSLGAARLAEAMVARGRIQREMAAFFDHYDLLLSAVSAGAPPPAQGASEVTEDLTMLTAWCNLAILPAASVPCGIAGNGVPVGLQVVGPRMCDELVLRACVAFEAGRGAFPAAPPLAAP